MNQLIIGRYIQMDSLVHQLDPRTKLLTTFYFILIVFFANSLASYAVLLVFILLGVKLS